MTAARKPTYFIVLDSYRLRLLFSVPKPFLLLPEKARIQNSPFILTVTKSHIYGIHQHHW